MNHNSCDIRPNAKMLASHAAQQPTSGKLDKRQLRRLLELPRHSIKVHEALEILTEGTLGGGMQITCKLDPEKALGVADARHKNSEDCFLLPDWVCSIFAAEVPAALHSLLLLGFAIFYFPSAEKPAAGVKAAAEQPVELSQLKSNTLTGERNLVLLPEYVDPTAGDVLYLTDPRTGMTSLAFDDGVTGQPGVASKSGGYTVITFDKLRVCNGRLITPIDRLATLFERLEKYEKTLFDAAPDLLKPPYVVTKNEQYGTGQNDPLLSVTSVSRSGGGRAINSSALASDIYGVGGSKDSACEDEIAVPPGAWGESVERRVVKLARGLELAALPENSRQIIDIGDERANYVHSVAAAFGIPIQRMQNDRTLHAASYSYVENALRRRYAGLKEKLSSELTKLLSRLHQKREQEVLSETLDNIKQKISANRQRINGLATIASTGDSMLSECATQVTIDLSRRDSVLRRRLSRARQKFGDSGNLLNVIFRDQSMLSLAELDSLLRAGVIGDEQYHMLVYETLGPDFREMAQARTCENRPSPQTLADIREYRTVVLLKQRGAPPKMSAAKRDEREAPEKENGEPEL